MLDRWPRTGVLSSRAGRDERGTRRLPPPGQRGGAGRARQGGVPRRTPAARPRRRALGLGRDLHRAAGRQPRQPADAAGGRRLQRDARPLPRLAASRTRRASWWRPRRASTSAPTRATRPGRRRSRRSLLSAARRRSGWTLYDTGGVTHQTVSGFTATGSSGGSLQFTSNRNLYGFRLIDGRGDVHELTRDDADPDLFYSMSPSVGLLGVVSTITFECTDLFAIEGQEAVDLARRLPRRRVRAGRGRAAVAASGSCATRSSRGSSGGRSGAPSAWSPGRRRGSGAARLPAEARTSASGQPRGVRAADLDPVHDPRQPRRPRRRPSRCSRTTGSSSRRVLEALPLARDLGVAGRLLAEFLSRAVEFGVDAAITILEPSRGRCARRCRTSCRS